MRSEPPPPRAARCCRARPGPAGAAGGERRRSPSAPGRPRVGPRCQRACGRLGTARGEVRIGTGGIRRPRKWGAVIAKRSRVLLVAVVLGGTDVAVCLGTGRVRVWLSFSFSCFWSVAGLRFSSGRDKKKRAEMTKEELVGSLWFVSSCCSPGSALASVLGAGCPESSRCRAVGCGVLLTVQLSSLCPFYFRAVAVFGHTAITAHSQPILFLLH